MKDDLTKGRIFCIISAVIVFGSYVAERCINLVADPTKAGWIIEALIFSVLTLIMYIFMTNTNNTYYGLLVAAFGYRMMPPDIWASVNAVSRSAGVVYFVVQKMAIVIFVFVMIKLFRHQTKERFVELLPILSILFIVPFFNSLYPVISSYLKDFTGTMLYSFFAGYALYAAAMLALLFIGNQASKYGGMYIADFQIVALLLNLGRKAAAIIINVVNGTHISRSYYGWIIVYAIFIVAFGLLKKKKSAELIAE